MAVRAARELPLLFGVKRAPPLGSMVLLEEHLPKTIGGVVSATDPPFPRRASPTKIFITSVTRPMLFASTRACVLFAALALLLAIVVDRLAITFPLLLKRREKPQCLPPPV